MNDKSRTGRILRPIAELRREERERLEAHKKWVEDLKIAGCPDPENPDVLAAWQKSQEPTPEEMHDIESFEEFLRQEEEELERIRESRPLGVPPPIEPRSIHSAIPQPPWKRKLRP